MRPPIKVLFVESGVTGGGSFESLYQTVRALDRDRIKPFVCFLNETRYLGLFERLQVPTFMATDLAYSIKVPKFIRHRLERRADRAFQGTPEQAEAKILFTHGKLIKRLGRIIDENSIALLYCNTQINRDIFGCFAARAAGIPMISHLRSLDGKTFTGEKARFANEHVDAYIANSNMVRDYWQNQGAAPEKMHVVFNAVDDQPVVPVDLRREFGIDPDNKIVICVGRLVWFKGHRFLLKSFARLLSKGTAATLILVGEGGERDGLHALARELDISDDVLFIGHDPRGPALAAGADALVLASSYEPFGRALIEAMSSGVPVIGTACGGIPDIIRHEENGLLVSYDDTEELASAMERLLADEALREHCIRGGSESVKTTFSLRKRTQDIEEIIENTLRNRESAPAFSASTSTGRVP